MNVFSSVASKSEIHFLWPALENPDNPKQKHFPDYRGFPESDEKSGLQNWFLQVKTPLLIPPQFGKLPLILRSTVANPEYHPLYFIHISPGWVRFGDVRFG